MTLLSVLTTYVLIIVGTIVVGLFVGQPPWPGEIVLPGTLLNGFIAINVGVRSTRARASRTVAWTAGPIAAFYSFILIQGWMESGRVALGSLFTSGALVAGLLIGWLLLHVVPPSGGEDSRSSSDKSEQDH